MAIMKSILKNLLRTAVLLLCSVIQVVEAIFMGIGLMFQWVGNKLEWCCKWLMRKFASGKYEKKEQAST